MSLADVLSAVKTLILDAPSMPEDLNGRIKLFSQKFDRLTASEIEDLAQISPEKFHIYTRTIFAGERNTLRNHFAITFKLLKKHIPGFDSFQMMLDLHRKRPWKSYLTKGLVENFLLYLENDRPDFLTKIPELTSVAKLERCSLEIARSALMIENFKSLSETDARSISVGDLMELKFVLPNNVRFISTEYDILSLRNDYLESGKLEKETKKNDLWAIGSRDIDHDIRWYALSENSYSYLSSLKRLQPYGLEDLAAAAVDQMSESSSEEELFREFSSLLFSLLERQALLLVKP